MPVLTGTLCYIFLNDGQDVLFIKGKKPHAPHFGLWNGLGGKFEVEDDGNPVLCVTREVQQEAGVTPTGLVYHGVIIFEDVLPSTTFIVDMFTASGYSGELKQGEEGELRQFPVVEVLAGRVPMVDRNEIFIDWLVRGFWFSAQFFFGSSQQYQSHAVFFFDR